MRYLLVLLMTVCIFSCMNLILLGNANVYANNPHLALIEQEKTERIVVNEGDGVIKGVFYNYAQHLETTYTITLKNLIIYKNSEEFLAKQQKLQEDMREQMKKAGLISEATLAQMKAAAKPPDKSNTSQQQYKIHGNAVVELNIRQTSDELSRLQCDNPYTVNAIVDGFFYPKPPGSAVAFNTIDRIKNNKGYNVSLFIDLKGSQNGQDVVVSVQRRISGNVYVGGQQKGQTEGSGLSDSEKIYETAQKASLSLEELVKSAMFYGKLDNANKTIALVTDSEFKIASSMPGATVHQRTKGEGVVNITKPFKGFKAPAKKKARADKKQTVDKVKEKKKVPEEEKEKEKEKAEKQKEKKKEKAEVKKDSSEDELLEEREEVSGDDDSEDGGVLDWVSDVTEDSWDYWMNSTKEVIGEIGYTATEWQYEKRDRRNSNLPTYDQIYFESGWRVCKEWEAKYHQTNTGALDIKCVNVSGKEVVYDGDEPHDVIDDPRYKGTYNYVNMAPLPKSWKDIKGVVWFGITFIGHGIVDVLPYRLGGNTRGKY
jgi:hypothetical protein